jgi:ribosomal protein S18 acetylase RimI-like enzyme
VIAIAAVAPAAIRELILEYAASLGVDLSFQDFEHELATLDAYYELALLAREGDEAAGCIALRRIDEQTCEMKRLYVRPRFRGQNLGRTLAEAIIDEGRTRGYARMRLDTLPSMSSAMSLYESLGFRDIAPYRFNPIVGSRYMELVL